MCSSYASLTALSALQCVWPASRLERYPRHLVLFGPITTLYFTLGGFDRSAVNSQDLKSPPSQSLLLSVQVRPSVELGSADQIQTKILLWLWISCL